MIYLCCQQCENCFIVGINFSYEVCNVCRYYDQLCAIDGKLPVAENQVGFWRTLTRHYYRALLVAENQRLILVAIFPIDLTICREISPIHVKYCWTVQVGLDKPH